MVPTSAAKPEKATDAQPSCTGTAAPLSNGSHAKSAALKPAAKPKMATEPDLAMQAEEREGATHYTELLQATSVPLGSGQMVWVNPGVCLDDETASPPPGLNASSSAGKLLPGSKSVNISQ